MSGLCRFFFSYRWWGDFFFHLIIPTNHNARRRLMHEGVPYLYTQAPRVTVFVSSPPLFHFYILVTSLKCVLYNFIFIHLVYDCLQPKVFYSLREGVACSMTHFMRFCLGVSLCAVGIRANSRGIVRIGFLVCTSQSGSNHHPNVVLVKVISYTQRAKLEIIETLVYPRTPFHPQGPTEEKKKKNQDKRNTEKEWTKK